MFKNQANGSPIFLKGCNIYGPFQAGDEPSVFRWEFRFTYSPWFCPVMMAALRGGHVRLDGNPFDNNAVRAPGGSATPRYPS